jgi:hypothetical protein
VRVTKGLLAAGLIILFIFSLWYALWPHDSGQLLQAQELHWRELAKLDYVTGQAPPELKSLDGKRIKIPGFMVPLEDQAQMVTEFLLVPTAQACIHVPPPPPNQMVLVKMKDKPQAVIMGPVWVYGDLHIVTQQHFYGESSFSLDGLAVEPYR